MSLSLPSDPWIPTLDGKTLGKLPFLGTDVLVIFLTDQEQDRIVALTNCPVEKQSVIWESVTWLSHLRAVEPKGCGDLTWRKLMVVWLVSGATDSLLDRVLIPGWKTQARLESICGEVGIEPFDVSIHFQELKHISDAFVSGILIPLVEAPAAYTTLHYW